MANGLEYFECTIGNGYGEYQERKYKNLTSAVKWLLKQRKELNSPSTVGGIWGYGGNFRKLHIMDIEKNLCWWEHEHNRDWFDKMETLYG